MKIRGEKFPFGGLRSLKNEDAEFFSVAYNSVKKGFSWMQGLFIAIFRPTINKKLWNVSYFDKIKKDFFPLAVFQWRHSGSRGRFRPRARPISSHRTLWQLERMCLLERSGEDWYASFVASRRHAGGPRALLRIYPVRHWTERVDGRFDESTAHNRLPVPSRPTVSTTNPFLFFYISTSKIQFNFFIKSVPFISMKYGVSFS